MFSDLFNLIKIVERNKHKCLCESSKNYILQLDINNARYVFGIFIFKFIQQY